MKYYWFKCPKCDAETAYNHWNESTKEHMISKKMDMRLFKSIRESVGQFNRNYVCPFCSKVSSIKEIKHSN